MNEILPSTIAKVYARELMYCLDTHRCLDWEGEKSISTQPLFEKYGGMMFGVLVAVDERRGEIVSLKAFSGEYSNTANIPGWSPPAYDETEYRRVVDTSAETIRALLDEGRSKEARRVSIETQKHVHSLHFIHTIDGVRKPLVELCEGSSIPSGTGDCCGVKLLNEAFRRGLRPVSMVEFFYGSPNRSKTKTSHTFYRPCDSRCALVLPAMIKLQVLYVDEHIIVVNKPSGLLSVPGIGADKQDCVVSRVKALIPWSIESPSVHRLDMDTSGLLVLGLTKEAQRGLSIQFMNREIDKSYIALLEGIVERQEGTISLAFRLDVDNRPYQILDEKKGKMGITDFRRIRVEQYCESVMATRMEFTPHTGRTHQLRVHSSHPRGLGHPIIGDRLYGRKIADERLMLHAATLSFTHPVNGRRMEFATEAPF
ncbi:MAG: RluA family pseudouridine synthase [Sphaerochaetaceae bacterium]|nr:RluA family pseudouridine synthase [Sphaerochaetaceae bacterium]